MIRVDKSDREELLSLFQQAVTLQVQLYDQLSAIEELKSLVTGLDDFVRREASDWMNPEDVQLDRETLKSMFLEIKSEK